MTAISSQASLSVADLQRLDAKPIQASQLPDDWAEHLKRIEESRDPELMAQRRAEILAKQNAVKAHTIFRKGGEVIAVLYENGSTTYPKGGDVANALGAMKAGSGKNLEGSALVDFMAEQMGLTLQSRMGGVEVESFTNGNAPTQGEMDFRLFGSSGGASPVAPGAFAALIMETQDGSWADGD